MDFCAKVTYKKPLKRKVVKNTLFIFLKNEKVNIIDYPSTASIIIVDGGLKKTAIFLSLKKKPGAHVI